MTSSDNTSPSLEAPAGTDSDTGADLSKGIMPDLIDPNHTYVFRTGDYGIKDYWYVDLKGNYWKYTNAPEDHEDFDPRAGVPLLVRTQPMPSTAPAFFTPSGRKRHVAVPPEIVPDENPEYNPLDSRNMWYEVYAADGQERYVYLDSDVRENIDLWVQYQLRVTDANLPKLRQFAYDLFRNPHPKDKIIGAVLMLMDQGLFELEELAMATVSDIAFIDETVKLLGRKFRCDPLFLDFLTSLVGAREPAAPLFQMDTVHGKTTLGYNHLYSIFHYLGVSPTYLLAWHASHMFSRIVNRMSAEDIPADEVEGKAFSELRRVFITSQSIQFLVDYKVRTILLRNYEAAQSEMEKSLMERGSGDDFATLMVFSDLTGRREDEIEFSEWLHAEPMHETTPAEDAKVQEMLTDEDPVDGADDETDLVDAGGEATGAVDAEGIDVGTSDAGEE